MWNKTLKQFQNVLGLFWSCFRLINIFIHVEKICKSKNSFRGVDNQIWELCVVYIHTCIKREWINVIHKRGASIPLIACNVMLTRQQCCWAKLILWLTDKPRLLFVLVQRCVSHVRSAETNPKQKILFCFGVCFGFVLRCFVSVLRATLQLKQNNAKQFQNKSKTMFCFRCSYMWNKMLKQFQNVLELFLSCFKLINIFSHISKNMRIPKQFQRSQPITDDHTHITLY